MLLEEIIKLKHYQFIDYKVDSWQDAIRISCQPLIDSKTVDSSYPELLINAVIEYGPYICLLPGLAMPHTTQNAKGVNSTAIAFTKFKYDIIFPEEKSAKIFFTLCAEDKNKHLANMEKLFTVLTDENIFSKLLEVKDLKELQEISEYENKQK
jgi:PTS system ascorbate-specific IIA component